MRYDNHGNEMVDWRMTANVLTCVVSCKTADALRRSEDFARSEINLDRTIQRTFVSSPGGVETHALRSFRLGDFFESIQVEPHNPDAVSFKLVFHPAQNASSYWKALALAVLRQIGTGEPGISVEVIRKST